MSRSMLTGKTAMAVAAALLVTGLQVLPAQDAVKVGAKVPDFKFQTMLNNDGRMSLSEFRGSVVLLDWWGNHCPPCLGYAVPHAIELQSKFGKDGLACILMESQQLPTPELPGFMMQKFPKNRCFVTSDSPFRTEHQENYVPFSAVIGVDGTLILDGGTSALGKKIETAIADELKKIKNGWGKSPEIAKARALMYGKNQLGEAAAVLKAAEQNIKPEAKEDFAAAKAELDAKMAVLKRSVTSLMAEGRVIDAQKAALAYQSATKGNADLETDAAAMVAEFSKPEVDKELKADQAVAKVLAGLGDKAPNADAASSFNAIAKKYAGTKVGDRAKVLADAAVYKIK